MIKVLIKIKKEGLDLRYQNMIHVLRETTPIEIVNEVEKQFNSLQEELLDTREKLVQKDYRLENATNKLDSLTRQNAHMKALLLEEWGRADG